jgi:murein DD-endopeptidase MepM/ murein hydrolase activator NlpD
LRLFRTFFLATALSIGCGTGQAAEFQLPTANHALFDANGGDRFFAPTPGKPWTSGCFGCVRSEGNQMHEGLDIRALQRDKKNEPVDSVGATMAGVVAYVNRRPTLSNYGNYIILKHDVEGMEIYSLYAHLREIRKDLVAGSKVAGGEQIGIMGRTTNTRTRIEKNRAHVHFEINCFVNDLFPSWYKRAFPTQRNDHQAWNGLNLIGLDPRAVVLLNHAQGTNFHILSYFQNQPELCRVAVRAKDFSWLRRYKALVTRNPVAEKEGIAGYEISLNYNGLPFKLVPRAASELKSQARYELLAVNAVEHKKNGCRKLVTETPRGWMLTHHAISTLDLLTYR